MGKVRHPIYSNSREAECGTWPEKGVNIGRHCVDSYSITAAPARSITHMSFWSCIYVTSFWAQSKGDMHATGSMCFSVRGQEVLSEVSEPTRTPRCLSRKVGLLLMKLRHPSLFLPTMIKSPNWVHTESTTYTKYSIHRVQHTPITA